MTSIPLVLVDDEPDLREALAEYFEACGFQVTAVSTAREALAVHPVQAPLVLLTDLTLPDRRGDELLVEFHRLWPECLLYVHSGDCTFVPNSEIQACGLTPDHVFAKPSDLAAMVSRFRSDLALL